MKITQVIGKEIFDSQGYPTLECTLILDDDIAITASVPSGTSKSVYEAVELRDTKKKSLKGNGVQAAIECLEEKIAPLLLGKEPQLIPVDMALIELDDSDDKSVLGANTMLATSLAVCKAQAMVEGIELYELIAGLCGFDTVSLPFPMFNMINGGMHAHNNLSIQEFMVMPVGVGSFRRAFELACLLHHTLESLLINAGKCIGVGPEGGFVDIEHEEEAFELLMKAIAVVQKECDGSFMIALDVAASHCYNVKTKLYTIGKQTMETDDLIAWYHTLAQEYPIYAIEDGLSDQDRAGWQKLLKKFNNRVHIVGDDIFATNPTRIWEGLQEQLANTVVIKPNQIGTLTEALQAIKLCKDYGLNLIASHRSRETNDTFIADLAVGGSTGHIKAGNCVRGERVAKYNRLLMIEDQLLMTLDHA